MFVNQLEQAVEKSNSLLCVGLDPSLSRLPPSLRSSDKPIFEFCRAIVDATHDLVCAFKPQIAYFSAHSAEADLQDIIAYIKRAYPQIPVILDAKRGDIGSTAEQYAVEAFDRFNADAVTINPYMGFDTAEPFLRYQEKGAIFLCRTSNPSAADFQDLLVDEVPIYQHVATRVADKWNTSGNSCLVVGATVPEQLKQVRERVGEMPLLVPGVGAQGGDVAALMQAGLSPLGKGLIINASRSILYASSNDDFAQAARKAAIELRDLINQHR